MTNKSQLNHEKIEAIINRISGHLESYVRSNRYSVLEGESGLRDAIAWCQNNYYSTNSYDYNIHTENPLTYIFVLDRHRNPSLTAKRISNIKKIQEQLSDMLKKLDSKDTLEMHQQKIADIEENLKRGIRINMTQSIDANKYHSSYKQNRSTGLGRFASWWEATFFQSRANTALEKALDELERFKASWAINDTSAKMTS